MKYNYPENPPIKKAQTSMRRFLLFLGLLLGSVPPQKASAQAPTISYPSVAQNLNRTYSQSKLTVKLVFNGVCTGTNTVRIALPASVTYVPGTVTKTSGTSSVSIAESSISNLSRPEFSITGIAAIGNDITFTIDRKANCGSLTTAKDSVYFIAGAGCSDGSELAGTVNTYNILSPALSITPAPALTGAVIDTAVSRTTVVSQGGLGKTDTLRFFIVYPSGGIINTSGSNAITANSVTFTPSSTSGDTLFYKIFGATIFGGNNTFDNAETVTIVEPIKVKACNITTTYAARWGSNNNNICQTASGTSTMTMATGAPNYGSNVGALIGYVDKCTPFEYTMTMKNTGTGNPKAATMFDLRILQGNASGSGTVLASFDTSLFSLTNIRIGTTSVPAANISWVGGIMYVELNNLFITDPDGVGTGLEDIDGDGFYDDLKAGNSVVLRTSIALKCDKPCNSQNYNPATGSTLNYREMCTATRNTAPKINAGLLVIQETSFAGSAYAPANIIVGTTFQFQAKETHFLNASFTDNVNTRYRWKIALPPGMSISGTGAPTYGGAAASYSTISGGGSGVDTIVYTSPSNALANYYINLIYAPSGPPVPISIYYFLEKINDVSTGCACQSKLICASISRSPISSSALCLAGPKNYVPVVSRANGSLGWTDYTMATRQTASAISAYDLSKALYLDTINIFCNALQGTPSNNLHIELTLSKTSIAPTGIDKLLPIKATSQFYRGGTLIYSCTTSTYSSAASTATDQVVDFDLSSCVAGLPGASLLADDSIASVVTYVVNTNDGLPTNDVQSGTRNIYYSLSGATRQYCNEPIPEMYLTGLSAINGSNAYVASACTPSTLGTGTYYLAHRFNTAGFDFANEFRPAFYVDSIVITKPSGYEIVTVSYSPVIGSAASLTPTSITGNVYKYVNPGGGAWTPVSITVQNLYGLTVPVTVVGSCATVNNEQINSKFFIRDYYYAYAGSATPAGLSYEITTKTIGNVGKTQNISYLNKPDISIANLTGTIQGTLPTHTWDVRLSNSSTATAPYTWLAIPTNPNITVTELKEISSGTVITPIPYAGGHWYQLSTAGITSGANKDYRIKFSYTSCSLDSIKLYGGWNCTAYPSDPGTYTCGKDSVFLKINPQSSQIQLTIARQPGGGSSIPLCTTDSTLLVINSSQAANLINPYIRFTPPAGLTLTTPIKIEYPLGSGDYQNATVTSVAGTYMIDLSTHTAIGTDGIKGTANANATTYPSGEDRQVKVKLDFTTDCAYTSGTSFTFRGYAEKPCGAVAVDNGIASTTSALNITGSSATGGGGVSMSFSGVTSFNCGASTTLSLSTTPTSVATQAGDTLVYTLPSGLQYAGNFVKGTNCSTCEISSTAGGGGTTVVKVKLQTGVSSGSTLAYSFDVQSNGGGCGSVNVDGAFKREITPLSCGGTPCGSSSVVIASAVSPGITLNKPGLIINNMTKLDDSATWAMGAWLNIVKVDYTNNGSLAYTGNTDTIEFFCNNMATTPFYKAALSKSLAIGASASDTFRIYIGSAACIVGDFVEARIATLTAGNTLQCLCGASALSASAPLPLSILSFNAQSNACAVQLKWEYSEATAKKLQSLVVQRSTDGTQFETITNLQSGTKNYVDVSPYSGQWLYRLRADYQDGHSEYTPTLLAHTYACKENTVQVYPNPAQQRLYIVLQGVSIDNHYELVDALGRRVLQGALEQNHNNQLAVHDLPSGIYMLRIITDSQISTQQVQLVR